MERKIGPFPTEDNNKIKSSFISQFTPENRQKTPHPTSYKHLSSSTFLDLEQSKNKFPNHSKISRKQIQYAPLIGELTRARSLKNIEETKFKPQLIEAAQIRNLNQNTLKLKAEELIFKLKLRFRTLLQAVNVSEAELDQFNRINKVDQIILFISEKINEKISNHHRTTDHSAQADYRYKQMLEKYQSDIEDLKSRLTERQSSEKNCRIKLKESHVELKGLYDKVNVKQKEYSQKMTEIYQLKMQMKEQENVVELLKAKLTVYEREKGEMRSAFDHGNKDHTGILHNFNLQKNRLALELAQTKQELSIIKQKEVKLMELNSHLNEQLTRWRERFEFQAGPKENEQKEKLSEEGAYTPLTPNDMMMGTYTNELKKSTMSVNGGYYTNFHNSVKAQSLTAFEVENTKLKLQIKELQKENNQLQRDALNRPTFQQKYEQTLDGLGSKEVDLSKGIDNKKLDYLKDRSGDLYRIQIENHYKKKTEEVAREWKEKLYDIVCRYEDDMELLQKEISGQVHEKETYEKKVYNLANEKYELETKLIEVEKEFYNLSNRTHKNIRSLAHSEQNKSQQKSSEGKSLEEIASTPHPNPIRQEDSPLKDVALLNLPTNSTFIGEQSHT